MIYSAHPYIRLEFKYHNVVTTVPLHRQSHRSINFMSEIEYFFFSSRDLHKFL